MTMTPFRMVEAHADLVERLRHNESYQALIVHQALPQVNDDATQALAVLDIMTSAARAAYAYRVSKDMTALVAHAAQMLDATDEFDPTLAPTGCGLVYFDGGIGVRDVRGQKMLVDWMLWGPGTFVYEGQVTTGVASFAFNDMIENPDGYSRRVLDRAGQKKAMRICGRWGYINANATSAGERLGPSHLEPTQEQYLQMAAEGVEPYSATNTARLLYAFWLLLNQTVTYSAPVRGMPPVARTTAKRARINHRVSVVELRRRVAVRDEPTGEQRPVEHDHQWLVRGFWRWQRHGPGNALRRRIWINDFVKGPADKPLRIKERVYDVKR